MNGGYFDAREIQRRRLPGWMNNTIQRRGCGTEPEALCTEYIVGPPNAAVNAWKNPTIPVLNGTTNDFFLNSFIARAIFQRTFRRSFSCFASYQSGFQSFFKILEEFQ
jgi:hypothetical protein